MRKVITAAVQMQCAPDVETNLDTAERLIRQAADRGAQIILLPSCLSALISVRSGGTAITATQCRQPKTRRYAVCRRWPKSCTLCCR